MAERIRNETCPGRYDKRKWPIRIEIESIAGLRQIDVKHVKQDFLASHIREAFQYFLGVVSSV